MTTTFANGGSLVAVVRTTAPAGSVVAQVRPGETREISLSDGNYQVFFQTVNGGTNNQATLNFTVGATGTDNIYVYGNSNAVAFNSRLANSYTLAGYTLPAYVKDNESFAFFAGFTLACSVRIFRAARSWFRRAGADTNT